MKAPLYTYTEVGGTYTYDSSGYLEVSTVSVASRPSYSTNTAIVSIEKGGTQYAQTISDYKWVTAYETLVNSTWMTTEEETLTILSTTRAQGVGTFTTTSTKSIYATSDEVYRMNTVTLSSPPLASGGDVKDTCILVSCWWH